MLCLFVKAENKKERKKCSAVLTSLGTHFAGNYLFPAQCIFFPIGITIIINYLQIHINLCM